MFKWAHLLPSLLMTSRPLLRLQIISMLVLLLRQLLPKRPLLRLRRRQQLPPPPPPCSTRIRSQGRPCTCSSSRILRSHIRLPSRQEPCGGG